jgi:hypothetical protein
MVVVVVTGVRAVGILLLQARATVCFATCDLLTCCCFAGYRESDRDGSYYRDHRDYRDGAAA